MKKFEWVLQVLSLGKEEGLKREEGIGGKKEESKYIMIITYTEIVPINLIKKKQSQKVA